MSSGLELIPLGIALVGILTKSMQERYKEQERLANKTTQHVELPTRMVDPAILADTLSALGLVSEPSPGGQIIRLGTHHVELFSSAEGNFWVRFDRATAEEVVISTQMIETKYSELFQQSLARQFMSNAQEAGMPIEQLNSTDGVIRLRVTVS
jgi:hypothetical protein